MAALRSYRVKCKDDQLSVEECEGYKEISIMVGSDGNFHRVWLNAGGYKDLMDALYSVRAPFNEAVKEEENEVTCPS